MLRKKFIAIVYVFSFAILLLGGFSYFLLKNYTTRFHYFDSVNRLLSSYNFEIHQAMLSKDNQKIQSLVDKILVSDSALQLVVLTDDQFEISSSRSSRSDDPIDLVYLIALDDVAPEDLQTHIIKELGVRKHQYALFSKNYYLHEQNLGRLVFAIKASDQFNSYLKNVFLGFAFIFLILVGLCLAMVAMVNRTLQGHQQMLKSIKQIDLESVGLTDAFKTSEDDEKNVVQIFNQLIQEIQRSYRELQEQHVRMAKSKEIFTTFLEAMEDGIVIRDRYRNVVYVNSSLKNLLGVTVELVGRKLDTFMPPKIDGLDFNLDMEIVDEQSTISKIIDYENRYFEVRKFCIPAEQGSYMVATMVKELTGHIRATKEKAALQRQMFLSSKMAAMGVFASGVAHEMINPMTVIQGNLELMIKEEEFSLTGKKRLEKIHSSIVRIKEFLNRLRTLEKPGSREVFKEVSVNSVINNVQQLLTSSLATYGIELKLTLGYDLPPFLGDSSLIENALLNLFINSRDAFERLDDDREREISIKTTMSPAGNLCIEFTDNAGGIAQEIQDKLFDPLFTTSEAKHQGLGLTLVREIIHQHDGDIFFFSTENAGTTFKIFLPRHVMEEQGTELRYRPRNFKNYAKDLTLFYMSQKSDFSEALRHFLLKHYNVIVCHDPSQIDEAVLKSCSMVLGEWPGDEEQGLGLVETIKKIAPQTPLVVMGRHIGDDSLHKRLVNLGAQEVLSRDFNKLDVLHDIIRKHVSNS